MKTKKDIRLYILMRTDLPSQGPGRSCAQASHATSVLEQEYKGNRILKEWKSQTPYGYGTCIVLGATKQQIDDIIAFTVGTTFLRGWTIDPDYAISISAELEKFIDDDKLKNANATIESIPTDPSRLILHRPEKTCYFFLGDKEQIQPYFEHLPLYQG